MVGLGGCRESRLNGRVVCRQAHEWRILLAVGAATKHACSGSSRMIRLRGQ